MIRWMLSWVEWPATGMLVTNFGLTRHNNYEIRLFPSETLPEMVFQWGFRLKIPKMETNLPVPLMETPMLARP